MKLHLNSRELGRCCKKVSESRSVLSPSFPPSKYVLSRYCTTAAKVLTHVPWGIPQAHLVPSMLQRLHRFSEVCQERDECIC